MKPALLVASGDGGVLKVDQVVALQPCELFPYLTGRLLVRVTDNDQIAHGGTSLSYESALTTISKRRRNGACVHQRIG